MLNNFYYAASTYLDDWMWIDRRFHKNLAFEQRDIVKAEVAAESMAEFATEYKVIRTLKIIREVPRLSAAYNLLQNVKTLDESDVVDKVHKFATDIKQTYGSYTLSAASKFLWMRFRRPVVIYDSIVSKWLCENCGYKDDGLYEDYYKIWRIKYREYEQEVKEACSALKAIKKFTLARGETDEQLEEWTSSPWFQERVFDMWILNAAGAEKLSQKDGTKWG